MHKIAPNRGDIEDGFDQISQKKKGANSTSGIGYHTERKSKIDDLIAGIGTSNQTSEI